VLRHPLKKLDYWGCFGFDKTKSKYFKAKKNSNLNDNNILNWNRKAAVAA